MDSKIKTYALTVCFSSLFFLVIFSNIAIYKLVKIISPENALPAYILQNHADNDAYIEWRESMSGFNQQGKTNESTLRNKTEAEITAKRLNSLNIEISLMKRTDLQDFIQNVVLIFIVLMIYFFHWRMAKR